MMEPEYICKPELPPLAWAIIKQNDKPAVKIIHGSAVECRDNFFVAGVWESDFDSGKIDEAYSMQGSGVVFSDDRTKLTICTSSNMQDALFSANINGSLYISNSLPYVMSLAGLSLNTDFYGHEYILNSSFFGLDRYARTLPAINGVITIWRRTHILLSDNGMVESGRYPGSPTFKTFDEYKKLMLKTLGGLIENGKSCSRAKKYGTVTTISRGYDAACVSALVHEVGCDKALTFSSPQKYALDSGVEIARTIGFSQIIEGNGDGYKNNNSYYEAESASGGDVGSLVSLSDFEKHYRDCLLFLGLKGDCIWDKNADYANSEFDFVHMSIAAEQNPEHFLNCNTLAISVPLILGDRWKNIYELSNSPEMQPYSVGGNYDRPIPRKIIESCGVERSSFGFRKMGAGFTFRFEPTLRAARRKMSLKSYKALHEYYKHRKHSKIKYIGFVMRYFIKNYPFYTAYVARLLHLPYKLKDVDYMSSPMSELMIQWGVSMMKEKYSKALQND